MIIKKDLKGAYIAIVFLFFVALLGSGCSDEQQFLRSSQVETTFQLKSGSGLNGAFTIQHAYLKLDRVVISGASAGKNLPNATLAIPADEPPFRLVETDSSHITFSLPAPMYDVMDMQLVLFADQYELVLATRPEVPIPEPAGSSDAGAGGEPENPSDGNSEDDQNDDGGTDSGNNTGNESDAEGESGDGGRSDGDEPTGGDDRDDHDQGDDDQDDNDNDKDRDDGDDEQDDDEDKKKEGDGKKGGDNKSDKGKKSKDKDDDDDDGKDERRSTDASNATVDLDHFFQNAKPGMVVFGTLDYNTQKISVIFVVTDPANISVRAMQDNGSGIVLQEQNASVVSFDAEQWVEGLTEEDLEDAVVQLYQGQAVLFIHKDFNGVLFEKLFSRLAPSATFRFDSAVVE